MNQTEPLLLDIRSDAEAFDLIDPHGRVFWKGMSKEDALQAGRDFGSLYQVVETTGLDYGQRAL